MATVTLMTTTDDPRVLDKVTTTIATVTAKPTENCSILSPRLVLNFSSSIAAANYMYIQEWNRYYFIDNITVSPGSEIIITGSVDVLKTYSAAIKNCTATVIRSESAGKPGIYPDNKLPIDPNRMDLVSIIFDKHPFSLDYTTDTMYLLQIRGVDLQEEV